MSEQFDNFKETVSVRFEEQEEQTTLNLTSERNECEFFKRNISDSIADIGADINEITETVKSNKNAVLGLRNKNEERIDEVDRKFSFIAKHLGICREGWEWDGEKCYYFSTDVKSWIDAAKRCNVLNGHLVEIRNANENSYVFSKIKNAANKHYFWIGLTDRALEGTFRWESSSLKTADDMFTNWDDGEPNDERGEDCAHMFYQSGLWNDFSCNTYLRYICESVPETFPTRL